MQIYQRNWAFTHRSVTMEKNARRFTNEKSTGQRYIVTQANVRLEFESGEGFQERVKKRREYSH